MRSASFGAALAAQRAYARQSADGSRFGFTVAEAFVRGIRDLGYRRNGDAVAELIDNALQAYAGRVDVLFGYAGTASSKKPRQLFRVVACGERIEVEGDLVQDGRVVHERRERGEELGRAGEGK